ncbi:DUF1800 family protein [Nakamurella sp. A5-74]|uniref:DUF1800 family protein n=1 Tax=Nakamurella sp. A5-74 TaxID=3158264 RepID=A0AAU8DLL5_9ACTN
MTTSGALDDTAVAARLLDRFTFGATQSERAAVVGQRPGQVMQTLLGRTGTALPDGVALPEFPAVAKRSKDESADAKKQRREQLKAHRATLLHWWISTATRSDHQLTERMAWFWSGHFATSIAKVRSADLMYQQYGALRSGGTGEFAALAQTMIVDPAMLRWLDGTANKVGAANENLSREFLELFALGPGGYTEDDVRAGARGLTGWTVDRKTGKARHVAQRHDDASVTFLGRTGPLDAAAFVAQALAQPQSPRFVIDRIWFRLVSTTPPDTPTLLRLQKAYGAGDLAALLQALALEPAWADPASSLVKQPAEWLIGAVRVCAIDPRTLPDASLTAVLKGLSALGQVPFAPPSVGGWPSGRAWLTAATAVSRARLAQRLAAVAPVRTMLGRSPAARVDALGLLLGRTWTDRTRAALLAVADSPVDALALALCSPEYVVSA